MKYVNDPKFELMFELPKERPITFEQILAVTAKRCGHISRIDYAEEWRYVLGYWIKKDAIADARAIYHLIVVEKNCAEPKIFLEKNSFKVIDWREK